MNNGREDDGVLALRGRGLRFVMLHHIRRRKVTTVAELVQVLRAEGYDLGGRESKVVSDALRWEVARGRVVRRRRGVYAYGRTPASTAPPIRPASCGPAGQNLVSEWQPFGLLANGVVAVKRSEQPPPTPQIRPDRLLPYSRVPEDPLRPPWQDLLWLWTV